MFMAFAQVSLTLDYELFVVSEKDVEASVKLYLQKNWKSLCLPQPFALSSTEGENKDTSLLNFPGKATT